MRLLFWYSGEHPSMPQAEAAAVFAAHGHSFEVVAHRPRFQVVETDAFADDALSAVERLGLTHDASSHLFEAKLGKEKIAAAVVDCCLDPGARFAVRAERLVADAGLRRTDAERLVGEALAPGRVVDLKRPGTTVRAFVDQDYLWAGKLLWDRDPKETAARHVKNRPSFSPVSLPPKLARALVNLTRIPRGATLYDPCCGTGGVLLEAAAMGIQVIGSDLDPAMVEGSRKNLAHYGFRPVDAFACDVGTAPAEMRRRGFPSADAVVTDLPYGRSASTGKEALAPLYERAFETTAKVLRPGGRAVIGVPTEEAARRAGAHLQLEEIYKVRVHRSLTRHFALLTRPGRANATP